MSLVNVTPPPEMNSYTDIFGDNSIRCYRDGNLVIISISGYIYNAAKGSWLRNVTLPWHVESTYGTCVVGTSIGWLCASDYNGNGTLMIRCDFETIQPVYGQIVAKIIE